MARPEIKIVHAKPCTPERSLESVGVAGPSPVNKPKPKPISSACSSVSSVERLITKKTSCLTWAAPRS